MAGGRKIMIWTVTALVIFAMAVAGLLVDRHFSRQSLSAIRSVPQETIALLRPLGIKDLRSSIPKNNPLLTKLQGIPLTGGFIKTMKKIDSALIGEDHLREYMVNNEMLLAIAKNSDSTYGLLVLLEIPDRIKVRSLGSFLAGNFEITRDVNEFNGRSIHRVEGPQPFYYTVSRGVFCGSPSRELLKMAVEQQAQKSEVFSTPEFREIMATSGKNVDANIFLNTSEFYIWTGKKPPLSDQWDFAALDLLLKDNGIMLNGFFTPGARKGDLYGMFSESRPVSSRCPDILPYDTREFYKLGFVHFDSLCSSLSKMGRTTSEGTLSASMGESERKHFRHWNQGEVTIARLTGDILLAAFKIRPGSSPLTELAGITRKAENHVFHGVDIYTISREGTIGGLLSPFLEGKAMPYFCELGDHIVFCSSLHGLQRAILDHSLGKTLQKSKKYSSATANITNDSHIYHYFDLLETLDPPGNYILKDPEIWIMSPEEQYRHFPVFTSQYTLAGKWYYASLSLAFSDSLAEEGSYVWKTGLRFAPAQGPFLISHPDADEYYFMAGNKDGITLLSSSGKVIWDKEVEGELMGEPAVISSENEAWIFLNTSTQLHKVNTQGQEADGFPVTLESEAASGLRLIRYPDTKEYRILIPGRDNKVYNFDAEGKKVKGWKHPEMPGIPAGTPQYLSKNKKDYLVFNDVEGNVLITDRRGKERVRYRGEFTNSGNSGLFLNQTNSRGLFITTNRKGHLVYIPERGKLQMTVFGDFSPDHYFFYTDVNDDGHLDFVYFDKLKVQVFDRFKNKLLHTDLPEELAGKPHLIKRNGKSTWFLFQGISGHIYQMDDQGKIFSDKSLVTETGFAVWQDPHSGMVFICVMVGESVFLFPGAQLPDV